MLDTDDVQIDILTNFLLYFTEFLINVINVIN